MPSLTLEFPIIVRTEVRQGHRHHVAKPLFFTEPEGVARLFERAMQKLLEGVRREFKSFKTERANIDRLLWYRFNPSLTVKRVPVAAKIGSDVVSGSYTAAWFDHDGMRIVCLPGFGGFLFVVPPAEKVETAVEEQVHRLLRDDARRYGVAAKSLKRACDSSELITTGRTGVYVEGGRFPFESDGPAAIYASVFREAGDFSGADDIERTGRDLTLDHPDDLMRAYGADDVVGRIYDSLYKGENVPTAIVGPRGVGKTTLVHEAVARHVESHKNVGLETLQKVWHLDPNRVIAGMSIVGMWQNRWEAILAFVRDRLLQHQKQQACDTLFIDNPVALLRVGRSAQNSMNLATVLKPYLEARSVRVVIEATPEAWKLAAELDRSFTDLFRVIRVSEPTHDAAIRVAVKQRAILERTHECALTNSALARIIDIQRRYPQRKAMPGAVVDQLKQIAAKHRSATVEAKEVDAAFAASSKLNPAIFDPTTKLDDREVREFVERRLVGQPDASRCLVDTIHTIKARLTAPERPFASLLFIGPTGVGKTEAAKVLGEYLFTDPESLIRFDMNEYIDHDAVARLIGDPVQPEGQLAGRVRYRPFCVLLFDEIEKAHESVHDLLLQVLGEGRVTDSLGRTVDFSNTVIVMTSNLGAGEASRSVGFVKSAESQAAAYLKAVQIFFRPEFVNRIDRIVGFEPLGIDDIKRIARLQIEKLLRRDGFVRRTTCLSVREGALDEIARKGFDPEMGGRALKRAIERELTAMAAERLIELPSNEPVVLEIHLRDGTLVPRIIGLKFIEDRAEPLPFRLPEERELRAFFQKLLDHAFTVERAVSGLKRDNDVILFRDRLQAEKQRLMNLVGQMPERSPRVSHALAMDLRPKYKLQRDPNVVNRDYFAQLDLREYFDSVSRRAVAEGAYIARLAVDRYIEAAMIHLQSRALQKGDRGGVCVHLRPLTEGSSTFDRELIQDSIMRTVKYLDPVFDGFDEVPASDGVYMQTTGPGFAELLRGDEGVHFIHERLGVTSMVAVRVLPVSGDEPCASIATSDQAARAQWQANFDRGEATSDEDPWLPRQIVRLYNLTDSDEPLATDLRTGLFGDELYGPAHFFWLAAALPAADRLVL